MTAPNPASEAAKPRKANEGRAQPHPQRCETCGNYKVGKYADTCKGEIFPDHMDSAERQYILDWVKDHGCASHSTSSQQQIPEPCKGCTDPNQCYVPCSGASSQQRIEQVISLNIEEYAAIRLFVDVPTVRNKQDALEALRSAEYRKGALLQAGDQG